MHTSLTNNNIYETWSIHKLRKHCKKLWPEMKQKPGMKKVELIAIIQKQSKTKATKIQKYKNQKHENHELLKFENRGRVLTKSKPSKLQSNLFMDDFDTNETKVYESVTKNIEDLDLWLENEKPVTRMWREFYKVIRWLAFLVRGGVVSENDVCLPSASYKNIHILSYVLNTCDMKSKICGVDFDSKLLSSIRNCPKNSLVLIDLAIFESDNSPGEGHANCLIIDLKKKTIERFEPNGDMYPEVDTAIKKHFIDKHFPNYKYINPLDFIPKRGPQYLQTFFGDKQNLGGFCITFSFLYFHLRVIHPDLKQKQIVEMIMKGTPEDIDQRIKKFISKVNRVVPSEEDEIKFERFDNYYLRPVMIHV